MRILQPFDANSTNLQYEVMEKASYLNALKAGIGQSRDALKACGADKLHTLPKVKIKVLGPMGVAPQHHLASKLAKQREKLR